MSSPHHSVLVFLAKGFEEIEAITVIDVLRRAGVEVVVAGLQDGPILASRQTKHLADVAFESVKQKDFDMVVLPGGLEGTQNLKKDSRVGECILRHLRAGKWIAAICAAPTVLHALGILSGKKITSHPSMQEELKGLNYSNDRVVTDGKIITSRGPGTSMEFSYKLVEVLCGPKMVQELNAGIMAKA